MQVAPLGQRTSGTEEALLEEEEENEEDEELEELEEDDVSEQ